MVLSAANYRMAISLLVGLLATVGPAALMAQKPGTRYEGEVFLHNGQYLEGELEVNLRENLLMVQPEGEEVLRTYSAIQVRQFNYFDKKRRQRHFFVSAPYGQGSHKRPFFFEKLWQGKPLGLMARRIEATENYPEYDYVKGMTSVRTRVTMQTELFFRLAGGQVVRYKGRKKELLQLMQDRETLVSAFIRRHDIEYDTIEGVMAVVKFYNRQFRE